MSDSVVSRSGKKSRKRSWVFLVLFISVVGAGAASLVMQRASDQALPAATASQSPKSPGIGGRGRIEPEDGVIVVAAPYFSGRPSIMSTLRVKEGDWIRDGQIIGEIDGRVPLEKALQQREAVVEVVRKRLAQAKAGAKQADIDGQEAEIARWQSEYEIAANDYRRYEKLRETQDVSAAELDQRRLIMERDKRVLDAARERLKSLQSIRTEDVEVVSAELAAALTDVEHARSELERVYIHAPVNGRVLKINAYPGEEVGTKGILELAKTDRMYAIAEVYETDIGRVRIGQHATVAGELLPEKLTGVVTFIDPQVSKSELLPLEPTAFADTRVVKVRIKLDKAERVAGLIYGKVDVVIEP